MTTRHFCDACDADVTNGPCVSFTTKEKPYPPHGGQRFTDVLLCMTCAQKTVGAFLPKEATQ